MAVVVFDPEEFRQKFPQFAAMSDAQLEGFWEDAQVLLDNTDRSKVKDVTERKGLLYKLVCHLATLFQRGDAVTGPITSVSQGSVSTSFGQLNWGSAQWYGLTPCGQAYQKMIQPYISGGVYYPYKGCG